MLRETYELLDKLILGIKHRCDIDVSYSDLGLVIRMEYRDNRNGRHYSFQRVFSRTELLDVIDEKILIDYFIDESNERIRRNYSL